MVINMGKGMRFGTMYQDFNAVSPSRRFRRKIIEGKKAMLDSGLDINGMFNEWGTFLELQKNNRADYLKRRFLSRSTKGGAWVFFM